VSLRNAFLTARNLLRRLPIALGYYPNMEWFRVRINPALVMDRARAHAAIIEIERCLTIQRAGQTCPRFPLHR
jgi:hypothetical protein